MLQPAHEGNAAKAGQKPILHIGAAFKAYRWPPKSGKGDKYMRFIFGIIIGCALTVGVAYITDVTSGSPSAKPMVNWDVVAQHVDAVTALAREGWKKIAG